MLLFFLKIMTQNCGTYVTVQLLQTLNILFENIRHETSLCKLPFHLPSVFCLHFECVTSVKLPCQDEQGTLFHKIT